MHLHSPISSFTTEAEAAAAVVVALLRGLHYITSAVGGGRGVPKKQTKGTKSADL